MARRNQPAAGCAGIGCLGFGLVLLGYCGSPPDSPSSSPAPSAGSYETSTASTPPPAPPSSETFYIHGEVNVRSGPGKKFPIVRTLSRGAAVELGPADSNGWAELYTFSGAREGYVYRASPLVRSTPPPAGESTSDGSRSTPRRTRSSGYHTGPRGGCYYYTDSGRKEYVPRSYCH
jgi:hypothetical protein